LQLYKINGSYSTEMINYIYQNIYPPLCLLQGGDSICVNLLPNPKTQPQLNLLSKIIKNPFLQKLPSSEGLGWVITILLLKLLKLIYMNP